MTTLPKILLSACLLMVLGCGEEKGQNSDKGQIPVTVNVGRIGEGRPNATEYILVEILKDKEFNQYLHLEISKRLPVKIAKKNLVHPIRLTIQGVPVQIVDAEYQGKDVIRFSKFKIDKGSASVEFTYDIEGVVAKYQLGVILDGWKIGSSGVAER